MKPRPGSGGHRLKSSHATPGVGKDAGDLHEPGSGVLPHERGEEFADDAEQPEDVEVAGRIIAEELRIVECAGPDTCESLPPRREVDDVDVEPALRQQDASDEGTQQQTDEDEDADERGWFEGQAVCEWPSVRPPPGREVIEGVAGYGDAESGTARRR